jgi:hypothetical protein
LTETQSSAFIELESLRTLCREVRFQPGDVLRPEGAALPRHVRDHRRLCRGQSGNEAQCGHALGGGGRLANWPDWFPERLSGYSYGNGLLLNQRAAYRRPDARSPKAGAAGADGSINCIIEWPRHRSKRKRLVQAQSSRGCRDASRILNCLFEIPFSIEH